MVAGERSVDIAAGRAAGGDQGGWRAAVLAIFPDIIIRVDGEGVVVAAHQPPDSSLPFQVRSMVGHPIAEALPEDLGDLLGAARAPALGEREVRVVRGAITQRLGEDLVAEGLLSRPQLSAALAMQRELRVSGGESRLGALLTALGWLSEAACAGALARRRLRRQVYDIEVRAVASAGDLLYIIRDISDWRRTEERLLLERWRADVRARLLQQLGAVGGDHAAAQRIAVEHIAESLGALCVAHAAAPGGAGLDPQPACHAADPQALGALRAAVAGGGWGAARSAMAAAALGQTPQILPPGSWRAAGLGGGAVVAAMRVRGGVVGALAVVARRPGEPFEADEAEFIQDLADCAGLALDNARLFADIVQLNADLQRSSNLIQTLFDGLSDGLCLLDAGGALLAANRACGRLFGARGWAAEVSDVVAATLADGQPHRRVERVVAADQTVRVLDVQSIPLRGEPAQPERMILHFVDVTERLQIEARALEQERLAASGRLVATVAHELNTPLQSIQSFLYLLGPSISQEGQLYLGLVRQEADRIGRIVEQLLSLYRTAPTLGPVQVNALVHRALLLVDHMVSRARLQVSCELDEALPELWGRGDQLMQVLLNLSVNAIQAMPAGGTLRIRTWCAEREGEPSRSVRISVGDGGPGIAPEVLPRIFEPFFTTKPEGTGLGLPICTQIVAEHGGSLGVETGPGGTTFTAVLPAGGARGAG